MMPRVHSTHAGALLGAALLLAVALLGSGCENKAIGRPCDLQTDAGANQPSVNGQALECPTRICMVPAKEKPTAVDTVPYCTAECSSDSDCEDGEKRDSKVVRDKRCTSGWTCGIATVTGSFCCKKLCLCKDFLNIPAGGLQKPQACMAGPHTSCPHI